MYVPNVKHFTGSARDVNFFVKSFQLGQYQRYRLGSTTIRKSVKHWSNPILSVYMCGYCTSNRYAIS